MFLTNQARVLLYISRFPTSTARSIAQAVGITERAAQRLIRDLDEAGYISRKRVGRNNEYVVHGNQMVSGAVVGQIPVARLLECLHEDRGRIRGDDRLVDTRTRYPGKDQYQQEFEHERAARLHEDRVVPVPNPHPPDN
jgi:DNA-binding Lrp family transcriptional regulator